MKYQNRNNKIFSCYRKYLTFICFWLSGGTLFYYKFLCKLLACHEPNRLQLINLTRKKQKEQLITQEQYYQCFYNDSPLPNLISDMYASLVILNFSALPRISKVMPNYFKHNSGHISHIGDKMSVALQSAICNH
jgi:hypothetical protein